LGQWGGDRDQTILKRMLIARLLGISKLGENLDA
jgi:hypothetical protein